MKRDLTSNVLAAESLRPAVYSADTNGQVVDLREADSAFVAVSVGAIVGAADDDDVIILEHSDEAATAFTAVPAAEIQGETIAEPDANTAYQFGYIGGKRYVRVRIENGGSTSVAASAMVVAGDLHRRPDGQVVSS
jgi:hypothetical protein